MIIRSLDANVLGLFLEGICKVLGICMHLLYPLLQLLYRLIPLLSKPHPILHSGQNASTFHSTSVYVFTSFISFYNQMWKVVHELPLILTSLQLCIF